VTRKPTEPTGTAVSSAGPEDEIQVRPWNVLTRDGTITLRARLLGFASSERMNHVCGLKNPRRDVGTGQCSACRWFEVTLLQVEPAERDVYGGWFAVATVGRTIKEGEVTRCNVQYTDSPREIIEMLMSHRDGKSFLPAPAQRALAQAAERSPGIARAYNNVLAASITASRSPAA
jgi:hypothetical protein